MAVSAAELRFPHPGRGFRIRYDILISVHPILFLFDQVTCGSTIKLMNAHHKVRLHSHDVKYGSGSGQQSVTGTEQKEDVNSHWAIKGEKKKDYSQ